MDRKTFIGSSEIASVLGLNPYQSPLQLWAIKTGEIEDPDLSDNEACEWGKRLEEVVAQKFAEKNKVKLMAYKNRFIHKEHPFLTCELDRIITGTDEIVEVKTCGSWNYKQWSDPDEIPMHYICQVMFALGLSGRRVGHFAVLCGGNKYLEKRILFDEEMYNTMVSKATAFWKMVQDKTPPVASSIDSSTLLQLYPENVNDEMIQSMQDMENDIARRCELDMHIKGMEAEKDEIDNRLKQIIGDNLGIKTQSYIVKWKYLERKSVDSQKLKASGLYDNYCKKSSIRVLRINKNKELT